MSTTQQGSSKPKRQIIHPKKTKFGRVPGEISRDELHEHFHLPMETAASRLGVGLTVLKQICRKFGIVRWPFRKVLQLKRLASVAKDYRALVPLIVDIQAPNDSKLWSKLGAHCQDKVKRAVEEAEQIIANGGALPTTSADDNLSGGDLSDGGALPIGVGRTPSRRMAAAAAVAAATAAAAASGGSPGLLPTDPHNSSNNGSNGTPDASPSSYGDHHSGDLPGGVAGGGGGGIGNGSPLLLRGAASTGGPRRPARRQFSMDNGGVGGGVGGGIGGGDEDDDDALHRASSCLSLSHVAGVHHNHHRGHHGHLGHHHHNNNHAHYQEQQQQGGTPPSVCLQELQAISAFGSSQDYWSGTSTSCLMDPFEAALAGVAALEDIGAAADEEEELARLDDAWQSLVSSTMYAVTAARHRGDMAAAMAAKAQLQALLRSGPPALAFMSTPLSATGGVGCGDGRDLGGMMSNASMMTNVGMKSPLGLQDQAASAAAAADLLDPSVCGGVDAEDDDDDAPFMRLTRAVSQPALFGGGDGSGSTHTHAALRGHYGSTRTTDALRRHGPTITTNALGYHGSTHTTNTTLGHHGSTHTTGALRHHGSSAHTPSALRYRHHSTSNLVGAAGGSSDPSISMPMRIDTLSTLSPMTQAGMEPMMPLTGFEHLMPVPRMMSAQPLLSRTVSMPAFRHLQG